MWNCSLTTESNYNIKAKFGKHTQSEIRARIQIITASAVCKYGNGWRKHEDLDLHWCYSVLYDKIIHENKDMKNKIRWPIHVQLNGEFKADVCSTKWRKPDCTVLDD